jgi:hypothetical protein
MANAVVPLMFEALTKIGDAHGRVQFFNGFLVCIASAMGVVVNHEIAAQAFDRCAETLRRMSPARRKHNS